MADKITRIVVSPTKFGIGSLQWAIGIATRHYRQLQCTGDIVLLCPRKDLKGSFLESAIGTKPLAGLLKGQTVIVNNCTLRLETPRTIQKHLAAKSIVVVFAHDSFINSVDALRSARLIIAAPEFEAEISNWIARWEPIIEAAGYNDPA